MGDVIGGRLLLSRRFICSAPILIGEAASASIAPAIANAGRPNRRERPDRLSFANELVRVAPEADARRAHHRE
jgi:hypothetical protein